MNIEAIVKKFRFFRAIYFFAYANTKSYLVKEMERETPLIHVISAAAAGSSYQSKS
jgi:hypothetical protein